MRFEDYVLTRITSKNRGLSEVGFEKFKKFEGGFSDASGSINPSDSGVSEAVSSMLEIGFNFQFDGTTYKHVVVCAAGWIALVDPTEDSELDVRDALLISGSHQNEGINLSNSTNNVLLAPWFDNINNIFDLSTVSNSEISAVSGSIVENTDRQRKGLDLPAFCVSSTNFGVRYFREFNSSEGRRLIVRWNSLSATRFLTTFSGVLTFECVLYENGKIEFRYDKLSKNVNQTRNFVDSNVNNVFESATIGVFASGTNRFRDFSPGLGLHPARQTYKYGGAINDSTFVDSGEKYDGTSLTFHSRNYTWRLRPSINWPGRSRFGSIFVFSPLRDRRRILPRREVNVDDVKSNVYTTFNDQRTINFGVISKNINFPTTLPRFFGGDTEETTLRQDVFSGGGMELETTGSITTNVVEQFISTKQKLLFQPFSEDQPNYSDPFFSSSNSFEFDETMNQPLWSKNQVKLSFKVDNKIKMLENTSSIYYLNTRTKSWNIPQGAINDVSTLSTATYDDESLIVDNRGFNAIGDPIMSASKTPASIIGAGSRFGSTSIYNSLVNTEYPKSIFVNDDYKAAPEETFKLPISEPFLIEKVVFEIPFEMGSGWFNDVTTATRPFDEDGNTYATVPEIGGPGLTVSLFNQIVTNNTQKREIIVTGTITHERDNFREILITNEHATTNRYLLRSRGFTSYAIPSSIVKQINDQFTGSITIKSEALSSYGPSFFGMRTFSIPSQTPDEQREILLKMISKEAYSETVTTPAANVLNVKPAGRAGDAIVSGRSIFGKEFGATKIDDVENIPYPNNVKNSLFLTGTMFTQVSSSIQSIQTGSTMTYLPLLEHFKSPYLVYPGDSLVLSVSKTRPHVYSFSHVSGTFNFSGSVKHDVVFNTGSINITLYGSYLRDGKDIINRTKKNLSSRIIYDVIGNDDVVDQFEVHSRGEYVGGMFDDFITGSLAKKFSQDDFVGIRTGSRGRVFSKFNARLKETPDLSSYEISVNPSINFRLKPWYESVGSIQAIEVIDNNERYFDTLVPGLSDCFAINGGSITRFISNGLRPTNFDVSAGSIFFNQEETGGIYEGLVDNIWMRSYPYEPRYSSVSRVLNITERIFSNLLTNSTGSSIISKSTLNGFIPLVRSKLTGVFTEWVSYVDVNLNNSIVTSSVSFDEISKIMYGFGDLNTMHVASGGDGITTAGTNHLPAYRAQTATAASLGTYLPSYGPIIRGWRYGILSGLPQFSKSYFRRGSYGQLRDMLEQRLDTKYFVLNNKSLEKIKQGLGTAVVRVKFLNANGSVTRPELTTSQNLSFEATSSLPYFADETRNRTNINQSILNTNIITFGSDNSNNIVV